MTFENFKKVLDAYRYKDEFIDTLGNMGIEVFDSKLIDVFHTVYSVCLSEAFTEEGLDWIDWYLMELPNLKEHNAVPEGGAYAFDADGNPLVFDTDEQLYDFLVGNNENLKTN